MLRRRLVVCTCMTQMSLRADFTPVVHATPCHATPRRLPACRLQCRQDLLVMPNALGRLQHHVLLPPRGRLIFMRTCISMVPLYPLSCMLPPGICGLEIRTDLIVQTISPADRLCHCNRTVPAHLRALWKILQAAQRHAGEGHSFPSARDMKKAEFVACGHRTNAVCIA
ncbi:uncharacterized protein SEPMUDRAFT_149887 [Sphaerulina musiva SO2202]|uniref:Uncharacterized protein n=1 Tax=Sphaerulina musiva (strain SO2202) TaxID=692275 RepID=N1QI48_SPHMS|nr:uncharacterized protein SEPMUDRAFT_149887 [Sphaerulina musiva SO2202]EMF12124.1 hypothetical protein SEPMUDRAFT_149887 [Sphaerulina musiva SO2202]